MKEVLFVRDFIARIGGDEFIAIVDGVLDDKHATELVQRMIEVVSQPIVTPEGQQLGWRQYWHCAFTPAPGVSRGAGQCSR